MEKIEHFLREVPFFKTLSTKEISFLSGYLKMENFASGETILKQGRQGSSLYLITTGVVSVSVQLPGDNLKEVIQLHVGQFFGEVSFLAKTLTTANITAKGPCECLVFYRNVLQMLRIAYPETAFKIERSIALQSIDRIILNIENINNIVQAVPEKLQDHTEHARHLPNSHAQYRELVFSNLDTAYIANLSLLKMLDNHQIELLLPYLSIRSYDRGYRLTSNLANDADPLKLAWLYSGAAMLFIKRNNVLKTALGVYGIGELLIQNFLFPNFQEMAEYVTCEESVILELDFKTYESLKKLQPTLYYAISQYVHNTIVNSLYFINREFVRISSEYKTLMK